MNKKHKASSHFSATEDDLDQVPFGTRFNDLFQSNRSLWRKMGGCVLLGAVLSGIFAIRLVVEEENSSIGFLLRFLLAMSVGVMAVCLYVGLFLVLKDAARSRYEAAKPVNGILRFYLGMGIALLVWIAIGVGIASLCIFALSGKW